MAMVKEEHENLLREIAESGGDTPKMLELLQKLRDDFDEREGTEAEEEKIRDESAEDNKGDGGLRRDPIDSKEWVSRAEYEDLRKKYIDRFFEGVGSDNPEEGREKAREKGGDEIRVRDLFKKEED